MGKVTDIRFIPDFGENRWIVLGKNLLYKEAFDEIKKVYFDRIKGYAELNQHDCHNLAGEFVKGKPFTIRGLKKEVNEEMKKIVLTKGKAIIKKGFLYFGSGYKIGRECWIAK